MPYPRENIFRKTFTAAEANKEVLGDIGKPGENMRWKLISVLWSYSAAPTGGLLTIEDGAQFNEAKEEVPFTQAIGASGPGEQNLGWQSGANVDTKVKLAAAGSGVTGRVTLIYTID
jgi:hypothetical protein